jgi:hypothetical protein
LEIINKLELEEYLVRINFGGFTGDFDAFRDLLDPLQGDRLALLPLLGAVRQLLLELGHLFLRSRCFYLFSQLFLNFNFNF